MKWLLLSLLVWSGGCAATVVPPAKVGATLPVFVADYGYHSSVILPRQGGWLVEYAYGDWNYFAQNAKSLGAAAEALLASKQATLGRRVLARSPNQAGLREATGAKAVTRFEAPKERVERLERELEHRFSARLDSIVWSYPQQLYFVMDDERYSVANNCNDLTARWLQELGCRIEGRGWVTGSHFKFAPQEAGPDKAADGRGEAVVAGGKKGTIDA